MALNDTSMLRVVSLAVANLHAQSIVTPVTDVSIPPVAPKDGELDMLIRLSLLLLTVAVSGCASARTQGLTTSASNSIGHLQQQRVSAHSDAATETNTGTDHLSLVSHQSETTDSPIDDKSPSSPETSDQDEVSSLDSDSPQWEVQPIVDSPGDLQRTDGVSFDDVINSVHRSYPLVEAAYLERDIANGNQVSAWGQFDTKLKAASENGPLGFYETYRNSAGFTTPIYGGGEFFGGYRNGGGDFQPWYEERETNDGGEFKGGVRVPLIRDSEIDSRRADLWRATYDQQIADPAIRMSLVAFSRDAGLAYWKWVAAGQKYELGKQWLNLAAGRNAQIERKVELGELADPDLTDNRRAIAKRQAKLADSLRVLQQSAAKLSLFLRDDNGTPFTPDLEDVVSFPPLLDISRENFEQDIARAQQNRPDLQALAIQLKRLRVDYAEAYNMTRPGLDAQLVGSQDVGQPTSKKRDKSEFELEAGLFFDVPLQRRKGRGKMQAVQAKMSQVSAKRRLVQDKVAAEVQGAYAGLIQTRQEALKARQAVELATQMADIERRKFELGQSDLLKVALREQYALEAAEEEISATYRHFTEFTNFEATLANDRPTTP